MPRDTHQEERAEQEHERPHRGKRANVVGAGLRDQTVQRDRRGHEDQVRGNEAARLGFRRIDPPLADQVAEVALRGIVDRRGDAEPAPQALEVTGVGEADDRRHQQLPREQRRQQRQHGRGPSIVVGVAMHRLGRQHTRRAWRAARPGRRTGFPDRAAPRRLAREPYPPEASNPPWRSSDVIS